ncbi:MAG: dephospho-CoA kinase [Planctomycetota bacterium]
MSTPPKPAPPVVIGLLGGVAAGKSTVAAMFKEAGLLVLDADQKAHAVVRIAAVKDRLVQRFGPDLFGPDGELRRKRLADLVFGDEKARRDLEAITHPAIRAELEKELDEARAQGLSVVLDVPLLLEGGLIDRCDHAVFVAAGEDTRLARALARGWDRQELSRREASQATLEQKQARCGLRVDNDGDLVKTRQQVNQVLRQLGLSE